MKHAAACTRLASLLLLLLALAQTSAASPGRYNFTVHENRPAGFQVGQVKLSSGFAYQLSPASSLFSFDSATGIITTKLSIDRETLGSDTVDLLIIGSSTSSVVSLSVRIHILDENDNSPRFPEPLITWEISENAIVGSARILPVATDPDVGANSVTLNYKITSGNAEGKFHLRVENSLGFLQLKLLTVGRLDREKTSSYSLNISAEDGGHPILYGYLAVQVTVEDYNDERPRFEQQIYQALINETVAIGQEIARVKATDADQTGTVNSLVTYRFKETPHKSEFEVDARTGAVRVAKPLSCFRTTDGCSLSIEATDNGVPQLHSENSCTVQITVLRSNDHSPEIRVILSTKKDDYAVIDETSKPDDPIGVVQVTDADSGSNGQTSLALLQSSGYFALRLLAANYYRIVTARTFTADSPKDFQLLLRAEDKGQPPRISTLTVTVRVNKANQFAPSFNESLKAVRLSQLAPVGSFVASMTAHDNDSQGINSEVRYQIVGGNDGDYFRIVHDSGLVLTKKLLKLMKQSVFRLNISASDSGPKRLVSYAMLQVQVERGNHAPVCKDGRLEFQVQQGNAFHSSLNEICHDSDAGPNGALTFSIQRQTALSSVNKCQISAGRFSCPRVKEEAQYVIVVSDQAQTPLQTRVHLKIRVVKNESIELQFYPLRYHVTTPAGVSNFGKTLTRLRASASGTLHYTMQSLRPDFMIDSNDGAVRMANYTAVDVATLLFLVNDEHGNIAKNPAIVRVYPEPVTSTGRPVFLQAQYQFKLPEDNGPATSSKETRNIGFISASGVYGYEIVAGDPEGIFSVSSSGALSVVKHLDREQTSNFNLTIVGLASADVCTCHVSIKVIDQNDNAPGFEWTAYEFNISDSTPIGQAIGTTKALDSDEGMNSKLSYELLGRRAAYFELDKDSGLLKLSYPVSKWLDAELKQGISLTVSVSDAGKPSRNSSVEVRVTVDPSYNDYPILDEIKNEFFVREDAAVNSIIGQLNASGKYSIVYSLSPFFSSEQPESDISVLPTGELYISNALDRETRDTYEIEVYATFFEPSLNSQPEWMTSSTTVTVYVQDVNDCSPIFSRSNYVFELPENSTHNHLVGRVFAADADEGANGHILYYLADLPHQGLFYIDPVLGEIRSLRRFDFENPGDREFEFAVVAKDRGSSEDAVRSGHARVRVLITDVNDHRPRFKSSVFRFEIAENTTEGSIVAQLSANDADSGLNGAMVFSFLGGNELGNFAIGENTGELRISKLLDRELKERFELVVSVSDKGEPKLSTTAVVFIQVLDCNDQKPVFYNTQVGQIAVSEDIRPGTGIHRFYATDRDSGNYSKFYFSIAFGNIDEVFGMDLVTGKLYIAKPLDYEIRSLYHLVIRATDFGGQFTQINFTVRVENVDDNAPEFIGSPLVIQVEENLSGRTIGKVVAKDADGDEISYHLVFQEPYGTDFRVDSLTGAIVVEKALDRERVAVYKLHIEARDRPTKAAGRRLTSAVTIATVIVDDVDDNRPVLHTQAGLLLPLTLTPGAKVARLIASDADQGENAKIFFAISGPDAAYFAVDKLTGELTLLTQPVEAKTYFDLLVKLNKEDSGQPVKLIVPSRENNGPIFSQSSYTGEVAEGTTAGREVLRMRALYAGNPRSAVQYLITGVFAGNRSEPEPRGLFHLVNSAASEYGLLQTGPRPLDREATRTGQYQLEVTALDTGSRLPRTRTASVYILVQDVNDSPPTVSASTLEVQLPDADEEANADVSWPIPLAQVLANDADDEDTPLRWRTIGDSWPEVAVQERTGLLTLVSRPPSDAAQTRPQLQLEVSDSQSHIDRVLVRFLPSPQRRHRPPTFQTMSAMSFNVTESAPPGSMVGRLAAVEAASYRLLMPWAAPFDLDSRWGILRTNGRLDYELRTHYLLVAVATDTESGLTSTAEFVVNVLDENDNAPVCRVSVFEVTMSAPGRVGEVLLTVQADDADADSDASFKLAWNSQPDLPFSVNPVTGEVTLSRPLATVNSGADHAIEVFDFIVVAKDDGGNAADCRVRVRVTPQDQILALKSNSSSSNSSSSEVVIQENSSAMMGVPFYTVPCPWSEPGVRFQLVAPAASPLWSINAATGAVSARQMLDRESAELHRLRIACRRSVAVDAAVAEHDLLVRVGDENDNSPVFNAVEISVTVGRSVAVNSVVAVATAVDADTGANAALRYFLLEDPRRQFWADADTGQVRLRRPLSGRPRLHRIRLLAQDSGQAARSASLMINVEVRREAGDVCAPEFPRDRRPLAFSVAEALPAIRLPAFVGAVRATDCDSDDNIIYQILDDSAPFQVLKDTGEIRATSTIDRESHPEPFVFVVQAYDGSTPRKSGSATVTVTVVDANDNRPTCAWRHWQFDVSEATQPGASIGRVIARDADLNANAEVNFELVDADNIDGTFAIDAADGRLWLRRGLDREVRDTYDLRVRLTDSGPLPLTAECIVRISVQDVNDNAPVPAAKSFIFDVPVNEVAGALIGGVLAWDPDSGINGSVSYSLPASDSSGSSSFIRLSDSDPGSGFVYLSRSLEGLRPGQFVSAVVLAEDGGGRRVRMPVTLRVRPAPEVATSQRMRFNQESGHTFMVSELAQPGTSLLRLSATLPGATYSILALAAASRRSPTPTFWHAGGLHQAMLTVRSETGELTVGPAGVQDAGGEIRVAVRATVAGDVTATVLLNVRVMPSSQARARPARSLYEFSVAENRSPGTFVGLVTLAEPTTGSAARQTTRFSISGGPFVVDSRGRVTTTEWLDREARDAYELNCTIDSSVHVAVRVAVQDDNDRQPTGSSAYFKGSVPENSPLGRRVLRITAVDADTPTNARLSFALTNNPGRQFAIDSATGWVTVASALDRESNALYKLGFSVSDGKFSYDSEAEVTVTDENDSTPEFPTDNFNFTALPGQPGEYQTVGSVAASDADQPGTDNSRLAYTLSGPGSGRFTVDTSGVLTAQGQLPPGAEFRLRVFTRDHGQPTSRSATAQVRIRVLDAAPPSMLTGRLESPVPASLAPGQPVAQVHVQDYPPGTPLRFRLVSGNASEYFSLDASTGWLTTRHPLTGLRLGSVYCAVVDVVSAEHPQLAAPSPTLVRLSITGENRFSPVITPDAYQATVSEEAPSGHRLFLLDVTDGDSGINGEVDLSIIEIKPQINLQLVRERPTASRWSLQLLSGLDFEWARSHVVRMRAVDRGFARRTAEASLTLLVADADDNPPRFPAAWLAASVSETALPGSTVSTVAAEDADSAPYNRILYSMTSENQSSASLFSIEPSTGLVKTSGRLDFEATQQHRLIIIARSPGNSYSAVANLLVRVRSVNEFSPVPSCNAAGEPLRFRLSPQDPPGRRLGRVSATDADAGRHGIVHFIVLSAEPPNAATRFTVNASSGEIFVEADQHEPNYQARSRARLLLYVSNPGPYTASLASRCLVQFDIDDGNDSPRFSSPRYTASISEAASIGARVAVVSAIDEDLTEPDRSFRYALAPMNDSAGSVALPFAIDPQTGQVTVSGPLDRETIPVYRLAVLAIDSGRPQLTASSSLIIQVTDINDSGPKFSPAMPSLSVQEGLGPGALVGRLANFVVDPDGLGHGAPFTFSQLRDERFSVASDGRVLTRVTLDRESLQRVRLAVRVTDSGGLSSELAFQVTVDDVNDNPSSSRPLTVLAWLPTTTASGSATQTGVVGQLAQVIPDDPDTTGAYQCAALKSPPGLVVTDSCGLFLVGRSALNHLDDATGNSAGGGTGRSLALSLRQHDGRHAAVVSEVTVGIHAVPPEALAASIVLVFGVPFNRVELGIEDRQRLVSQWPQLSRLLLEASAASRTVLVSLREDANFLGMRLALRDARGFLERSAAMRAVASARQSVESITGLHLAAISERFCNQYPCKAINSTHCRYEAIVRPDLGVHAWSSKSLTLAAPTVEDVERCHCPRGYAGPACSLDTRGCSASHCANGGICHRDPAVGSFRCLCPAQYAGSRCQFDAQECRSNPCANGATCEERHGGFRCTCPTGWAGRLCDTPADLCESGAGAAACLNSGVCVPMFNAFRCHCPVGFYGRRCETAAWGFPEGAYAAYRLRRPSEFSMTMEVTGGLAGESLLVLQPFSASAYISLTSSPAGTTLRFVGPTSQDQPQAQSAPASVASGWTRINVTRFGQTIAARIAQCDSATGECPDDDSDCELPACRQLSFRLGHEAASEGGTVFLASMPSSYDSSVRPSLAGVRGFVGCMRRLVTGHGFAESETATAPLLSGVTKDSCPRPLTPPCRRPGVCSGVGVCIDEWTEARCDCPAGTHPPDCSRQPPSVGLGPGGHLTFTPRPRNLEQRKIYRREVTGQSSVSLKLKATALHEDQLVLYSRTSLTSFTLLLLSAGSGAPRLISVNGPSKADFVYPEKLSAGRPHSLTIIRFSDGRLSLTVDDGEQKIDSISNSHDFLGDDVESMTLAAADVSLDGRRLSGFVGCLAELRFNGMPAPLSASLTERFRVAVGGSVSRGCRPEACRFAACQRGFACTEAPLSWGGVVCARADGLTEDQLRLAIAVPGALGLALLLLLVLACCLVARRRRRHRYKKKTGGSASSGLKSGAGAIYSTPQSRDAVGGLKSGSTKSNQDSGFCEEALIRRHIQNELAAVRAAKQLLGNSAESLEDPYELGPAEHYDLDNASSIAGADTDAVRHYRAYRKPQSMPRLAEQPSPSRLYERCGSLSSEEYHRHRAVAAAATISASGPAAPPINALTLDDIRRAYRRNIGAGGVGDSSSAASWYEAPPPPPMPPPDDELPPPLPPGRGGVGFNFSDMPQPPPPPLPLHAPGSSRQLDSLMGWNPASEFRRLAPVFSDLGHLPPSRTQEDFV